MHDRNNHSNVFCSTIRGSVPPLAGYFGGFILGLISVIALLAACETSPEAQQTGEPELESRADSVAYDLMQGLGGFEAWHALPYLRFDFAIDPGDGSQNVVARHYWDRQTDDYRVEWSPGEDSTLVALFNVQNHEDGGVYLNGEDATTDDRLQTAYSRFINDTYWALAPTKTFDEGVNRAYVADSSDAQHEVIRLSFGEVGLTPGDQYWMYVNNNTQRLDRWAYVLERAPDNPPSYFEWQEYEKLDTSEGPVSVSTRKQSVTGDNAILTPVYELSEEERQDLLSSPEPRLE